MTLHDLHIIGHMLEALLALFWISFGLAFYETINDKRSK